MSKVLSIGKLLVLLFATSLLPLVIFCFMSFSSMAQIPAFSVTVHDSAASTGYYFLSTDQTLLILDKWGSVVYYRNGVTGTGFTLQPNGMMSYWNVNKFRLMDSTFTDIDSVRVKNNIPDVHDFQILPNGHYALFGKKYVQMDLSSYFFDGQYGSPNATVSCGVVQEQDVNKNVVFEWHTEDYFSFGDVDSFWLQQAPVVDWNHPNTIEMDTDGNYMVSHRHFNEITKINRIDSSVIWRFGGSKNQFSFVNFPVPFYGQHDIRRLPNGNVMIFDNGQYKTSHDARSLEFQLDEVNKIATLVWSYTYDSTMYSRSQGNTQRLDNLNTLINYGPCNFDTVCFVVVDSIGSKIFELNGITSYRAFNFQSLPWQLNRPQINCFDSLGTTYLDAGLGYASYNWNNGMTSQVIPISANPDTFYVFVPYGQNGFISSEKFIVSDTTNLCGPLSASFIEEIGRINIYPNPACQTATLNFQVSKISDINISIYDIAGKKISEISESGKKIGNHSVIVDISKLNSGLYFLKLNNTALKFIKK